eukprot:TRINITY_DN435_c0_g1_i7.p1 TRINITY_DN435_c0_g1~~TRINITY_DN435_c0_g1_i7.p1  ORF type:complete len:202 (-),score=-12.22 TRINITY_DN435_c0_g1_i7:28-543(-)
MSTETCYMLDVLKYMLLNHLGEPTSNSDQKFTVHHIHTFVRTPNKQLNTKSTTSNEHTPLHVPILLYYQFSYQISSQDNLRHTNSSMYAHKHQIHNSRVYLGSTLLRVKQNYQTKYHRESTTTRLFSFLFALIRDIYTSRLNSRPTGKRLIFLQSSHNVPRDGMENIFHIQ